MRNLRSLVIFLLFLVLPATLLADVKNLPAASTWYFHADFEEMRSTEAGRHLYGWLQDEVITDVREESGFDIDKEADTLTAWSVGDDELVVVIDGNISQETEDKLLAMGAASGAMDKLGSNGKNYYHIKDGDGEYHNGDIAVDGLDDGIYFSFAVKNKLIITSSESDMQSLIANKGQARNEESSGDALFVISAERNLLQAGVKAGEMGENIGWDSNILRNTERAALLVADKDGRLAFEAQLVTSEKEMADSLASIARGLISLQVFNDELDPEIADFLQHTTVDVNDNTLVIKVDLDPKTVVEAL
jgi:hypothetical protein